MMSAAVESVISISSVIINYSCLEKQEILFTDRITNFNLFPQKLHKIRGKCKMHFLPGCSSASLIAYNNFLTLITDFQNEICLKHTIGFLKGQRHCRCHSHPWSPFERNYGKAHHTIHNLNICSIQPSLKQLSCTHELLQCQVRPMLALTFQASRPFQAAANDLCYISKFIVAQGLKTPCTFSSTHRM